MKVALPVMGEKGMDEMIGGHFGKSPSFAIFDSRTKMVTTISNTSEHMGGTGLPPELLAKNGVKVVVCSALGPKAVDMLSSLGIDVYVGACGTVKDGIDAWQMGKLEPANANNACKEHHH